MLHPLEGNSDPSPGLYPSSTGADEEILVVCEDGTSQILRPSIQSPKEFDQTARAIPRDRQEFLAVADIGQPTGK